MVLEGLRAYLQLANGLTEVTRKRATAAARSLVAQGEAGVEAMVPPVMRAQVAIVTEDLMATSKANRDLLLGLVRVEVERTVNRLGLVSAAELEAATSRARSLDDRVRELERALRVETGGGTGAAWQRAASSEGGATAKSARTKKAAKQRSAGASSLGPSSGAPDLSPSLGATTARRKAKAGAAAGAVQRGGRTDGGVGTSSTAPPTTTRARAASAGAKAVKARPEAAGTTSPRAKRPRKGVSDE